MPEMKFYIDTHDQRSNTFPAGISKEQFQEFFSQYEKACVLSLTAAFNDDPYPACR